MRTNQKKLKINNKKEVLTSIYWPLVPINAQPIRKEWVQKFHLIQEKIKKYGLELESFVKKDQPAFEKWKRIHFGKDYLEIQQENEKLHELRAWIEEVANYVKIYEIRDYDAYQLACLRRNDFYEFEKVIELLNEKCKRMEDPLQDPFEEENEEYDEKEEDDFSEIDDDDLGFTPDENSKEFQDYFNLFKENIFLNSGLDLDEAYSEDVNTYLKNVFLNKVRFSRIKFHQLLQGGGSNLEKVEGECKALYRRLVRILHPDRNQEGDKLLSTEKEIWSEVQNAYHAKDTDKLRALETLVQLHRGFDECSGSISDLQSAIFEFEKNLWATQAQIKKARQNPAWKFEVKKGVLPQGKWVRVYKKICHELEIVYKERIYFQSLLNAIQDKKRKESIFY